MSPGQQNPLMALLIPHIRNRGKEGFRVGMAPFLIDRFPGPQLHDVPQVHNHDAVAEMLDNPQIVGNEHVRQVEFLLDVLHQVDDLSLNGHVQGADRLIADHKFRIQRNRPGDSHTLPLAAGKLMGIAVNMLRP